MHFEFEELSSAPLVVGAVYKGGPQPNLGGEPISKLIGGGNLGGFRYLGSISPFQLRFCVLYSDGRDPEWPDSIDPTTGALTYFGDNKEPGNDLHATPKHGNAILREIFLRALGAMRSAIPPIFYFEKAGETGRDVRFRGLAVPGSPSGMKRDDLVALWTVGNGEPFLNYRAVFTLLEVEHIARPWIDSVRAGASHSESPATWLTWRDTGRAAALRRPT